MLRPGRLSLRRPRRRRRRRTTRTTTARTSSTLLGKILRIDVDRKDDGKNYAIPKDNPFVGKKDARPEIWAYGLRNVWRMAFDRKTGKLWAGDVGPEPVRGDRPHREGRQLRLEPPRGAAPVRRRRASGPSKDLIEPIWEYHHDVGKSITGGARLPRQAAARAGRALPLRRLRDRQASGRCVRREGRSASSPTGRSRTRGPAGHVVRRGREGRGLLHDLLGQRGRAFIAS